MDIDLADSEAIAAANQAGGPTIALPLLQLISEARNEHGMRQQDYARYRHFCSKKTHRLREILALTHSDGTQKAAAEKLKKVAKGARGKKPKKAQAAADQSAATKGHGNVFTPKTLRVQDVHDERPAQLLLFEAERAWAFSQELRTQAFENDADPALRQRGISRLRRAVQWSTSLHQLVCALNARFDVYARSETAAYSVLLKGIAAFDRNQWSKALELLSVARLLLNAIADNSMTSRNEALANSFVDAGEAQMRYCAYQLGEAEQNMDTVARKTATAEVCNSVYSGYDALVAELEAAAAKNGAAKSEPLSITWHGHQIPVRNLELLDTITRVRSEEAALHDAIRNGSLQDDSKAATRQEGDKANRGKRPRLSHAQRKAKKREAALAEAGPASPSSSSTPAQPQQASGSSTSKIGRGGRTELDPFDRALSALTDAEEVARRLVEDNAEALAKSHSARYETASKDLQMAHDYLLYRLLALRIARNSRLVADVERKSERREKRAWSNLEKRLEKRTPSGARSGKSKARRQQDAAAAKAAKLPKRNQPGARAKAKRTVPRVHRRRPARSGTRALRSRQAAARVSRARAVAAGRAKRRRARAVPALAKLLDGAEISLNAMASIALVESEPDVSSLVEAKAAWYRSELLRHLARAFSLSDAKPQALLLITRAQLYVRQARQAAELAEDVEEEDADFPPVIHQLQAGKSAFDESDLALEALKRQIQKEMYLAGRSAPGSARKRSRRRNGGSDKSKDSATGMTSTKAGQALLEMAQKHVDFDPVDLDEAKRIPQDVVAECERELQEAKRGTGAGAARGTVEAKRQQPAEPERVPHEEAGAVKETTEVAEEVEEEPVEEEKEEVGNVSTAYDPGNALAEEEEARLAAEAANKKKGWLGGWFGRG
ncbi:signal recognition particle subunit srp68 [Thecaphora frezii]